MPARLKDFLKRWAINTVAVLVATHVVKGIHFDQGDWVGLLLATLVLGLLNTFVRPVLLLLSLPLVILSLGLFTIVINAFLLYLVGELFQTFHVDSFGAALLGALIISIISILLNSLTGSGNTRVKIHRRYRGPRSRRGPPNRPNGGNGSGPVIDV
jgi:putative membrane protein